MAVEPKTLDEILGDISKLYSQSLKRMINRSLDVEMDAHLGYGKSARPPGRRRTDSRAIGS